MRKSPFRGPVLHANLRLGLRQSVYCVSRISGMGLRMSRWESLRSCLRHRDSGHRDPDEMLQMELSNLKFRFDRIDESKLASDVKKKLNGLFEKPDKTWDDAYHIEKQIAMLLSGDRLHQEITFRLREAVRRNAQDAADLQTDYATLRKGKKGDEDLRNFLQEVLEDNHWDSKLKYLKRKVRLKATRNTLSLAAVSLLFVLLPYILLYIPWLSWLRSSLYTALTFGLLGALFSRLITLQRSRSQLNLEELHNAQRFWYIILRACIGTCGALIAYFFLQSGLVTGNMVPEFREITNGVVCVSDRKSLALLIIWSFIAGFSESLVPSVLSSTERQFGGAMGGRAATPES
jgi:hypothetical protein